MLAGHRAAGIQPLRLTAGHGSRRQAVGWPTRRPSAAEPILLLSKHPPMPCVPVIPAMSNRRGFCHALSLGAVTVLRPFARSGFSAAIPGEPVYHGAEVTVSSGLTGRSGRNGPVPLLRRFRLTVGVIPTRGPLAS